MEVLCVRMFKHTLLSNVRTEKVLKTQVQMVIMLLSNFLKSGVRVESLHIVLCMILLFVVMHIYDTNKIRK